MTVSRPESNRVLQADRELGRPNGKPGRQGRVDHTRGELAPEWLGWAGGSGYGCGQARCCCPASSTCASIVPSRVYGLLVPTNHALHVPTAARTPNCSEVHNISPHHLNNPNISFLHSTLHRDQEANRRATVVTLFPFRDSTAMSS